MLATILLYLLTGFAFFLKILYWAIIIDVILSWLTLFGLHIVIGPLASITRPLYQGVSRFLPTRIGVIDISPILIFLFIQILLGSVIPGVADLLVK